MALAGQETAKKIDLSTPERRKLGAQLLLSEVLEYVIKGLGVTPIVNGTPITEPDALRYENTAGKTPSPLEMVDGLADVAYTMYWNALAFGLPLEEAYDLVCDNNLEKFIRLEVWSKGAGDLSPADWHCDKNVSWPSEVTKVRVIKVEEQFYAVGTDSRGKVRKPSSYRSVDLSTLLPLGGE